MITLISKIFQDIMNLPYYNEQAHNNEAYERYCETRIIELDNEGSFINEGGL